MFPVVLLRVISVRVINIEYRS